jgi:hypothetical protein
VDLAASTSAGVTVECAATVRWTNG